MTLEDLVQKATAIQNQLSGGRRMTQEELDNIQDIYDAALDLVECVEKYVRQETSRSTLIWKKEKLKKLLEK